MPFARLSIKTALRVAQNSVELRHHGGDMWIVRTRRDSGGTVDSEPKPRAAAKVARRVARIFFALLSLGLEEDAAMEIAMSAAEQSQDWRHVVASSFGKVR